MRWGYKIVPLHTEAALFEKLVPEVEKALNESGRDGWELVSTEGNHCQLTKSGPRGMSLVTGHHSELLLFFKRPLA